jgi:hypothetical protein
VLSSFPIVLPGISGLGVFNLVLCLLYDLYYKPQLATCCPKL